MNITELFNSLKAYIHSVIGDKITIINGKTVEAEASAARAKTSENNAKTSENNAASAATTAVTNAVNELKGGAPAAYDTLKEVADELAANQTLHASMLNQVSDAATKAEWANVTGKPSVYPTNVANVSDLPAIDREAATPGTLAQRAYTTGCLYVGEPGNAGHAATKNYVDTAINTRAPSSHTHTFSQIPGLGTTLNGKVDGAGITLWVGKQAAYDALPSATKNAAGFVAIISG